MHPKNSPGPHATAHYDFWKKLIKREIDAWTAKFAAEETRQREHELRRKTLRINDGSNQCLPPSAWMTIADRIAN